MDDCIFKPIGTVRNPVTEPMNSGWGAVESSIELLPSWHGGLDGLGEFSHVLIVTHLHQISFPNGSAPVRRHPRNRDDMPLLGVFAQRARVRPNPIGVTACPIVRVEEDRLVVTGLDAIDGTPVLDIKPYVPTFDLVDDPTVPKWVETLLADYL